MRTMMAVALLTLVGCDVAPAGPGSTSLTPTALKVYINDPAWLTDCAAGLDSAGLKATWMPSPEAATIRVRIFAHSDCGTSSTGAAAPSYSCPGGPISVWPRCGNAAAEIGRHVRLRLADAPAVERVDACSHDLDY